MFQALQRKQKATGEQMTQGQKVKIPPPGRIPLIQPEAVSKKHKKHCNGFRHQ